jgi:hypothetical protein
MRSGQPQVGAFRLREEVLLLSFQATPGPKSSAGLAGIARALHDSMNMKFEIL